MSVGEIGSGVQFTTNGYMQFFPTGVSLAPYTVFMWFLTNNTSATPGTLFDSTRLTISLLNGSAVRTSLFNQNGAPYFSNISSAIPNYNTSNFHSLAYVDTSGMASLYVDGRLIDTFGYNGVASCLFINNAIAGTNIGRSQFNSNFLSGNIDELAIYNRALTGNEILTLASGTQLSGGQARVSQSAIEATVGRTPSIYASQAVAEVTYRTNSLVMISQAPIEVIYKYRSAIIDIIGGAGDASVGIIDFICH
jgi:hypothetical protein